MYSQPSRSSFLNREIVGNCGPSIEGTIIFGGTSILGATVVAVTGTTGFAIIVVVAAARWISPVAVSIVSAVNAIRPASIFSCTFCSISTTLSTRGYSSPMDDALWDCPFLLSSSANFNSLSYTALCRASLCVVPIGSIANCSICGTVEDVVGKTVAVVRTTGTRAGSTSRGYLVWASTSRVSKSFRVCSLAAAWRDEMFSTLFVT